MYHSGFNTILFLIYRAPSALIFPPEHHQLPIIMPTIHNIQSSISEIKILCMELPVTIQNSSNKINQVMTMEQHDNAWQTFNKRFDTLFGEDCHNATGWLHQIHCGEYGIEPEALNFLLLCGRYVYCSWITFFTKLHNRFTNLSILSMHIWLATFWWYLEQWFPSSTSFQGLSTFALTSSWVWRLQLLHRLCVWRSGCRRVWWSGIEVLGVHIPWLCHWEYFLKFHCL